MKDSSLNLNHSEPFQIKSYGLSHVGMKRSQNEDSYLINDELDLYMVADGMGGHRGGEFASQMAISTVEEIIEKMSSSEATIIQGVNSENVAFGEQLKYAFKVASARIFEQALYDPSLKGMGTTSVALLVHDGQAYIAHVGDSRVYLIRNESIQQVTEDHSLLGEQLKAGLLSEEEIKNYRYKNIITRSVGFQEEVECDLQTTSLQANDCFLLCSDGLSNLVQPHEMIEITQQFSPKIACERLIELANSRGGDDNITAVIVQVVE